MEKNQINLELGCRSCFQELEKSGPELEKKLFSHLRSTLVKRKMDESNKDDFSVLHNFLLKSSAHQFDAFTNIFLINGRTSSVFLCIMRKNLSREDLRAIFARFSQKNMSVFIREAFKNDLRALCPVFHAHWLSG